MLNDKVMRNGRYAAVWLCLLWLITLAVPRVLAQEVTAVDSISVEIWPDYDQANVLVLITGQLNDNTPLPATVRVPLPPQAQINAVARITADNFMSDDIEYTTAADGVTLTTPERSFRLEYYYPYTAAGEQRELTFNWTADFSVERFIVSVQQPFSSANLTTNPAADGVATSHVDGLTYHVLPTIAVPAGQAYEVAVNYEMTSPLLTAARLANQTEPAETEGISAVVPTSLPNWALYLAAAGIALVGVALFWQAYNQRQKTHQPAQRRGATKAEYCHQCGQRRQKGDQFCRDCGAHLK